MNFSKNDNLYRPLMLHHSLASYDKRVSKEENLKRIRKELEQVIETGYGGVVTNVTWFSSSGCQENYIVGDYLSFPDHWELLQETIKICKEMGLRVWIYDEKGYPSGGAGGVVVQDHPEYEAYGLVCLEYPVLFSDHLSIQLPRGHEKVVSAFAITEKEFSEEAYENRIDLTEFVDEEGTLCWDSTIDGTVYYIVTKPLFEGTHAERNYHEHRRYPDVLDKDAIKYFIGVTYDKYKKYLGEYFGNTIEAFFTDEPSILGRICYVLDREPYSILDVPDKKMPIFPHVVWSRNFVEEFKNRKSYDIMAYIPMLFSGDSKKAREVRSDYHQIASDLYEEAFYVALEEFCAENNVDFSGHLLGDDLFELNIMDEIDSFKMLKHMHTPGIDILTAIPKKITRWPTVIKLASSVAHNYNRKWVMSESSGFSDKGACNYDSLFGSIATQYACGVNLITSYFGCKSIPSSDYKKAFDGVSRMGQLLEGGMHKAPLMIYYPAEDAWQHNIPSSQVYSFYELNPKFKNCCDSFEKALKFFMDEKIDYDLVDRESLERCKVENGKIVNPFGEEYNALYISAINFENARVKEVLAKLSENGAVIYVERSRLTDNKAFKDFTKSNKNIIVVDECKNALEDIYTKDIYDINVCGDTESNIIYIHKFIDGEHRYMFVNTSENEANIKVTFKHSGAPKVYDVKFDNIIPTEVESNNNTTTVPFKLGKYQAMFVIF